MKRFQINRASFANFCRIIALSILVTLILITGAIVYAQSGDGYDLSWWTVSGGGVTGQTGAGGYSLGGTSGQPSAAVWAGGNYSLSGGFWVGSALEDYAIYLPILLRNG